MAKDTPVTKMMGQISIMALRPAKAQISQNGTSTEKNGSWRPTMAVTSIRSYPWTLASVITGVPSAPKARSEEHTSELQSQSNLVCRLLLEKKKKKTAQR